MIQSLRACPSFIEPTHPVVSVILVLTYDVERDGPPEGGRGVDLALVDAGVGEADVPDGEHPVLGVRLVQDLEPLVLAVEVRAHRDQVHLVVANPGDLRKIENCVF